MRGHRWREPFLSRCARLDEPVVSCTVRTGPRLNRTQAQRRRRRRLAHAHGGWAAMAVAIDMQVIPGRDDHAALRWWLCLRSGRCHGVKPDPGRVFSSAVRGIAGSCSCSSDGAHEADGSGIDPGQGLGVCARRTAGPPVRPAAQASTHGPETRALPMRLLITGTVSAGNAPHRDATACADGMPAVVSVAPGCDRVNLRSPLLPVPGPGGSADRPTKIPMVQIVNVTNRS
jgi:hypothetical protein